MKMANHVEFEVTEEFAKSKSYPNESKNVFVSTLAFLCIVKKKAH